MRLGERYPEWAELPTEQLLQRVPFATLSLLIYRLAEWYQVNLPLWAVLQHVGYDGTQDGPPGPRRPRIGPETDPDGKGVQVSCMFPGHSNDDEAPSARYYRFDRNNSTWHGHIFCFGSQCQKAYTSFWYLYRWLGMQRKIRYSDVILYIEGVFDLPFPRRVLLEADPDDLDDNVAREAQERALRLGFVQAGLLREGIRSVDRDQFLAAMAALYTEPLQCEAVSPS